MGYYPILKSMRNSDNTHVFVIPVNLLSGGGMFDAGGQIVNENPFGSGSREDVTLEI